MQGTVVFPNDANKGERDRGALKLLGGSVLDVSSLLVMNEKGEKWSNDNREFDAVMLRSRNGTQGENWMDLIPFRVPRLTMLFLMKDNVHG